MDELDRNFTAAILKALEEKLKRSLTGEEVQVFLMPRSLMAYEMILDYIEDKDKTKEAIENYVANVVQEYRNAMNNKAKRS